MVVKEGNYAFDGSQLYWHFSQLITGTFISIFLSINLSIFYFPLRKDCFIKFPAIFVRMLCHFSIILFLISSIDFQDHFNLSIFISIFFVKELFHKIISPFLWEYLYWISLLRSFQCCQNSSTFNLPLRKNYSTMFLAVFCDLMKLGWTVQFLVNIVVTLWASSSYLESSFPLFSRTILRKLRFFARLVHPN